ncbi:MAG: HPr family phosphocarrier protein [candidate division WOR-3 bacterium]|nr:HPr family phosphocarrier protein [candidate division WOR-3 bacterium]
MIEREIEVKNKLGLHARPAALFVKTASTFNSKIEVCRDDTVIDGKSIMGLMMLAAESGSKLKLIIDGEDEERAMEKLVKLIEENFNEA